MLLYRLEKNWELCVLTPILPKGLSWYTRKRHFLSFKNGFTPDDLLQTMHMRIYAVHSNSGMTQYVPAKRWLWICCKKCNDNYILILRNGDFYWQRLWFFCSFTAKRKLCLSCCTADALVENEVNQPLEGDLFLEINFILV